MYNIIEKQIDKLAKKIKTKLISWKNRLKAYLKRLLLPIYLFPIKLITYSLYYTIKFAIKTIIALIKIIIDMIVFPFKSLKNLLKAFFIIILILYIALSLIVIVDYLNKQYGNFRKVICSYDGNKKLQNSVVRVVGGYNEGSGFFVDKDQIITNFHVIAAEPSPKIILPDGKFITPTKIIGRKDVDLAIIYVKEEHPELVFTLPDRIDIYEEEKLISTGYPLGTTLNGKATMLKGNFIDIRKSKNSLIPHLQTNINVINGMSGGPLTDVCGNVVGINTLGFSGMSLFISADWVNDVKPSFTDRDIKKIEVDPTKSPEAAVEAFYTYLKVRRMEDSFNLLSSEYLKGTNFEEWTSRFTDVLDFDIIKTERYRASRDTAFVKFSTKNWINEEVEMHYYEGVWVTVLEDGVFKMLEADIVEVSNPTFMWFYE